MQLFLFFCVILFALSTEVLSHHSKRQNSAGLLSRHHTKRYNSTLFSRHHTKRQNGPNGFNGFDGNKNNNNNNNICQNSNKPPADGTQNRGGACVLTAIGELPSANKMTSCIITKPPNTGTLKANQPFDVEMVITNIQTGAFSDPATQYYVTSQTLNQNGLIMGHTHVTIQKINGPNAKFPPDASVFAFFKGADDPADAQGRIRIPVPGLAQGNYRICTLSSSLTHQPVVMPVAQRGSQDDCIRIKVQN